MITCYSYLGLVPGTQLGSSQSFVTLLSGCMAPPSGWPSMGPGTHMVHIRVCNQNIHTHRKEHFKKEREPGIVVLAFNPSTAKAEAGEFL